MIKQYGLALLLLSSALINTDSNFTRIRRAARRINAKGMRVNAAESRSNQALGLQPTNGDEQRYPDKRASYTKALPHQSDGLPDVSAFNKMVYALQTGNSDDFLAIPMGTNPTSWQLHDPQASLAFNFVGTDSWIFSLPAPPSLTSAEMAADMVEDYWQALMRDVPFNGYNDSITYPITTMAIADLNTLSDFKGPKINGQVTPQTLFRGLTAGDLVGPYISQFLYLGVPYGPAANTGGVTPGISFQAQVVPQTTIANYFMTSTAEWLIIQNGGNPSASIQFTAPTDVGRLFIRNGQDLGSYVHQDSPPAPYINAAMILLAYGANALDPNNPYLNNPTQKSFVTYNNPDLFYLLSMAAEIALRTAWYFKWQVHRKLRPEVVGFYVNQQKTGVEDFGLNAELINSSALPLILSTFGTYLLPMAYSEGAPAHPSYPAGHATVAGTCATILKAFFNEDFVIPNAIEPNPGNTALIAYNTTPLLVGDELNKLASNVAIGRDFAGVHYRSDATASIQLGEQIALALLEDEAFCRNINFKGYKLTKFDGTQITVGAKRPFPRY